MRVQSWEGVDLVWRQGDLQSLKSLCMEKGAGEPSPHSLDQLYKAERSKGGRNNEVLVG